MLPLCPFSYSEVEMASGGGASNFSGRKEIKTTSDLMVAQGESNYQSWPAARF